MLASLTYGWVDLELDSDGDGLKWDIKHKKNTSILKYSRDHVDDFDDDNDGILDVHDEDDDGDGIVDLEVRKKIQKVKPKQCFNDYDVFLGSRLASSWWSLKICFKWKHE